MICPISCPSLVSSTTTICNVGWKVSKIAMAAGAALAGLSMVVYALSPRKFSDLSHIFNDVPDRLGIVFCINNHLLTGSIKQFEGMPSFFMGSGSSMLFLTHLFKCVNAAKPGYDLLLEKLPVYLDYMLRDGGLNGVQIEIILKIIESCAKNQQKKAESILEKLAAIFTEYGFFGRGYFYVLKTTMKKEMAEKTQFLNILNQADTNLEDKMTNALTLLKQLNNRDETSCPADCYEDQISQLLKSKEILLPDDFGDNYHCYIHYFFSRVLKNSPNQEQMFEDNSKILKTLINKYKGPGRQIGDFADTFEKGLSVLKTDTCKKKVLYWIETAICIPHFTSDQQIESCAWIVLLLGNEYLKLNDYEGYQEMCERFKSPFMHNTNKLFLKAGVVMFFIGCYMLKDLFLKRSSI